MSFASSFNMLGQFSSNKKANTHTQNAHESCEFQKGKKTNAFLSLERTAEFSTEKMFPKRFHKQAVFSDIDRDALMKDATLKCVAVRAMYEVKIAQDSVDAWRGDI
ncbi:hypothetical protein T02_13092 [Trichinella nativa]|uniref:Uncharacterized protein n=1 Tax=Trichinella nativa TaxID=6335 RepID=A0A0V1L725_9BILA|nr:hypothetical protein T02_13092 [Trichinella nativa]